MRAMRHKNIFSIPQAIDNSDERIDTVQQKKQNPTKVVRYVYQLKQDKKLHERKGYAPHITGKTPGFFS